MRAARLHRPGPVVDGPLQLEEVPDPQPGDDELLVEVTACAVCRTDLQLVEGDLDPHLLPVVPGHQAVGRVVEVGRNVSGWDVGERVGIGWLASVCGTCRFCTSGRENLCESATFTGWDRDGGYATLATVRADVALRMPAEPTDLDVAPLLCGGVIGYHSLKVAGVRPGTRLGLYGFGASASLAIQVAVHWGCEVYVVTRSVQDQERARRLGAAWAGGYDQPIPAALDAAVTFAPAGWVVARALADLDRGATVAINAIHLDQIPAFDYRDLWWERQIRSVANYTRADAMEFLDLAAEIPVTTAVDPRPLEEANQALADLSAGTVQGTPVLVTS